MHVHIGTDEAGYGPNLGPLVIGATRFESAKPDLDVRDALAEFVFETKAQWRSHERQGNHGLMVADSKAVYSSGNIQLLERGVLSFLAAIDRRLPQNVNELLNQPGVELPIQGSLPSYFDCSSIKLPIANEPHVIESLANRIGESLQRHDIELKQMAINIVLPRQFNDGTIEHGNKASLLTVKSLELVRKLVNQSQEEGSLFSIRCDKHGGRSRYAPAIQEAFAGSWVNVEQESRPCSRYRFLDGKATIDFSARGESWFPIALASMCAKYVREVFMIRWNEFWQQQLPDLKPTKGYPVDAKRFVQRIESTQKRLGIAMDDIWRQK